MSIKKRIKRFFGILKYFDPIEEVEKEWDEHIYDNTLATEEILEKVRGNNNYIQFKLQRQMAKSSEKIEKLTFWLIILTLAMIILGIVQMLRPLCYFIK